MERSFLGRKTTERATTSQVINSRHSNFLTVNQDTNTSKEGVRLVQVSLYLKYHLQDMEQDTFDLRDLAFLEFVFAKRELTYLNSDNNLPD